VGEWPPYLTKDLKHNGAVAHLIKDILEDIGYQAELIFYPWARAYSQAAKGKDDLTGVWMHKLEREEDFYYSEPVLSEKFVFFHLKGLNFNWDRIQDLAGLTVLGMKGYSYGEDFDKAIEKGNIKMIDKVTKTKQGFGMLLLNRAQLYPQEMNIGNYELNKHFTDNEIGKITYHSKPFLINNSYLLFPKKTPKSLELLKKFNEKLKVYRATGKYDSYFKSLAEGFYN
jgi:polar amino acid transport system substrate-binding protein